MTKNLSSGLEDYIETIYLLKMSGMPLKGADLARKLNISRASVSEALSKLKSLGLIEYESYSSINLTSKGEAEAKKVYNKHGVLKNFFEGVLKIKEPSATENACKIEHIVSEDVIKSIKKFIEFYQSHPKFEEEYLKSIENK